MTGGNRDSSPIMAVRSVSKVYRGHRESIRRRAPRVQAVDHVSLEIYDGETVVLVGESGSGKSTLGRIFLRLTDPDRGEVSFRGSRIDQVRGARLRSFRRRVQIVFQDPFSSLNPRMRVRDLVVEGMRIHHLRTGQQGIRVAELIEQVGLPADAATRFPHEFSGGQRQRIALARALAYEPDLIVCDEPVAALDVLVQAQILNLLQDLKERHDLALLFITHDLGVARVIADRVAVMQHGSIVELAASDAFFAGPSHEYSRALLDAVPIPEIPADDTSSATVS